MTDLRKAAEQALEALETLWNILDDIDTASDMAKENDAWYRKRVEALQKKRWDTMITTDGYKLKGGPVEALRQALAQHVDAVNISQERVDETDKFNHITVVCHKDHDEGYEDYVGKCLLCEVERLQKREWVGLSGDEREHYRKLGFVGVLAVENKLKEKNT